MIRRITFVLATASCYAQGMTDSSTRIRIALVSIVGSSIILAMKWLAYLGTGSAALKSDALEGIVNVAAALFALGALVYAEKPSDREHPYGHGKMENFSAAFEGGLVTLAAALILYEGVSAILVGAVPHQFGWGIALNAGAGCLNGALGWFLLRSGRKHQSRAIEADGHHVLSDFYTTVGILAGLGLVWLTGWVWLDGAIAVAVGLVLVRTGFKLVQNSSSALLDSEDPETLGKLVDTLNQLDRAEIITVHGLRTMRSGRYTHIDAHVVIPEFLSVREGHDLVERHCQDVLRSMGLEGEFHSHVDPCRRAHCASCQVVDCPVRRVPFQSRERLTLESVVELDAEERMKPG